MSNEIVVENQRPGTPMSTWRLYGPGSSNIEGFAADMSVDQGQPIDFKIKTDSTDYRIEIYRLGYYGGDGARLVTTIQHQGGSATVQPAPLIDPANGLVDAGNWSVTDSWSVPSDAVSGVYLAKLVRQDGTYGVNTIPFIVRDDDGNSDVLFQTDDATWQSYNPWGGASFYPYSPDDGIAAVPAVSYNRPVDNVVLSYYIDMALPAIMWLEKNGYDVSYFTNVDSARNGGELLDHKMFISIGKDEYWSAEQYNNVMAARDAGVNLQFWSGNDIYWKTQWKPSIDGSNTDFRTLITYKETARGISNPDGVWTGTWSDPNNTEGLTPPNALTGSIFGVLGTSPYLSPIDIPYDQTQLRFWRNTTIADTTPGQTATLASTYLGPEWNLDLDNGYRPEGLINLSETFVTTTRQVTDYTKTGGTAGTAEHNLTLYKAASGALVFSAGTMFWSWALDGTHAPLASQNPPPDPNVQQAMVNLFADMGVQPETLVGYLKAAARSTDFTAPEVNLNEFTVSSTGSALTWTVNGTATDIGGKVAGIEITANGGARRHPVTGTGSWTYTGSGALPTDILARSVDDSLNIGAPEQMPSRVLARTIVDGQTGGSARAAATHDVANSQPWSVVWNNYDAAGNWNLQSISFDDGTAAVAQLDTAQVQSWSVVWDQYDTAEQWVAQSISFDDGSKAVATLDPNNSHSWSLVWDNFDASGNWLNQTVLFTDGSRAVASLNPLGDKPWSVVWDNYNANGAWSTQSISFLDGTSAVAILDPLNTQSWSVVWDNYDTVGNWVAQSIEYKDGTRGVSNIDWANVYNWASDNYIYDNSNTLRSHYQVMDDGSTVYITAPQTV